MSPSENELQILYDLHGKYYNHLLQLGFKLGWSKEDLKDIINQMFVDFADQGLDLSKVQNTKSYISVSFRNRLVDAARANKRKEKVKDFLSGNDLFEKGINDKIEYEEEVIALSRRLKKIYENLPPRCRRVIRLKFYEGLTTDEIVEKTGLTPRTVYNNLFEGLKLLRAELQPTEAADLLSPLHSISWIVLIQKIVENSW